MTGGEMRDGTMGGETTTGGMMIDHAATMPITVGMDTERTTGHGLEKGKREADTRSVMMGEGMLGMCSVSVRLALLHPAQRV